MIKNRKLCAITAVLTAAAIITAAFTGVGCSCSADSDAAFSTVATAQNPNNSVSLKPGVKAIDSPDEIKQGFTSLSTNSEGYTLNYSGAAPEFFKEMKPGEVFCVYPDSSSEQSYFSRGFCGKLSAVTQAGDGYSVSFTVPSLTEVFSDIYINTAQGQGITETSFIPSQGVELIGAKSAYAAPTLTIKAEASASLSLGDSQLDFSYSQPDKQSLLDDYTILGKELKLEYTKSDGDIETGVSVTLEYPAVRLLLDYHTEESTGEGVVDEYSLGFISKHRVSARIKGEQELSLTDVMGQESAPLHIIDIVDVTEAEKGKYVLGTYLIGLEAKLPILNSDVNKVSYLSFGIALQLTATASGKLSLEYELEESGFTRMETDSKGNTTVQSLGYDYPNPVIDSSKPQEAQYSEHPDITTRARGEMGLNLGVGVDCGVCIMGMIPMKLANNLAELNFEREFDLEYSSSESLEDELSEICTNNYILDEHTNNLSVGSSSFLKLYMGANLHVAGIKDTLSAGAQIQLYNNIFFQYPSPLGFSHSQCDFGGISLGESYTDDELDSAFNNFKSDVGQDGFLDSIGNGLVSSTVNGLLLDLGLNTIDLGSYLGLDLDNCTLKFYSPGALYVRDESNTVVAAFITGEEIFNSSGFGTGTKTSKAEQLYSAPSSSSSINLSLGFIGSLIFGVDEGNVEYTSYVYNSSDSSDRMELFYDGDTLKLIMLSR